MFLAMVQVVQAGKSLWAGAYHKGLWGGGGGQEVGRVGAHCRRQERVKEKGDGGQSRTDIAETPSTKVWNLS